MSVPSANPLPLGGVALTLVSEQLSVAKEAVENATTVEQPTVVLVVTSAGQSIVGDSLSWTITANGHVAFGKTPLLAVTVTTLLPSGKAKGEAMVAPPSV